MSPLLQIFLGINLVAVGIIATIAVQHALAHFGKKEQKKAEQQLPKMPSDIRKKLIEEAEVEFRKQIDKSTKTLQTDLAKTADQLSQDVTKLGGQIIETEMKRYRETLDALRRQSEHLIGQAQQGVARHQEDIGKRLDELKTEMEAKVKEELAADREHLAQQIDTKLADAVSSFLVETLQHNVDLGAQTDYMISMLEEHKEELVNEVKSGS